MAKEEVTLFPHIIYILCTFPKVTLMVQDTLDSSAHYLDLHFRLNYSFDISARM